ncbi:MAG: hypothetical protein V2J62_06465 [candidate division KSB1 bacterium]|jgi:hypothetical protein|nr:hypothetical protein [candidate division KSB1 bacterium]
MTIQELLNLIGEHPIILLALFTAPVVLACILSIKFKAGAITNPWKRLFSVLTYSVCVPGIFSLVLIGYTMFFQRGDLTRVNVLVYFLPVVSMIITLSLIRKSIAFDDIPGFDRLSGLMVILAISFAIALGIEKTRLWILFRGSILLLFGITAVLYILLHLSLRRLMGSNREDRL